MDISIVIPLFNEDESIQELVDWIKRVLDPLDFSYEIILVDDGSKDRSWPIIEHMAEANNKIRAIKFRRNYGKSAGLYCGFAISTGDVVFTMDADLQDSPEEIPALFKMIKEEGFDLVSGWKKKRYDPLSKTLPTKLYNATVRFLTGIHLHDMNCGLKAYRKEVVKGIEVYGEMHRYIPVMAKKAGFNKIGEKIVHHQKRKYGVTKFGGWQRFINGPLDLMSILFITKYGKRPMHFFGSIGLLMFFFGAAAALFLGIQKIYYIHHQIRAKLIVESPYFFFAITSMIIGTQLFLAGFLGEMISRNSTERNNYLIEKEL